MAARRGAGRGRRKMLSKTEPGRKAVSFPRRTLQALAWVSGVYVLAAYFVLPTAWRHYDHFPELQAAPKISWTRNGIAADPLNIALIGTRKELVHAMLRIGWHPADPITFRTSLKMAADVLLRQPYPTAPVSRLYVQGRPQDLAFQLEIGGSPRRRHHVRFWEEKSLSLDGRPVWIGSAALDERTGVSRFTGQFTHHIDPAIDNERNTLIRALSKASLVRRVFEVAGVGPTLDGRNGAGDRYFTDGKLSVAILGAGKPALTAPPSHFSGPVEGEINNNLWDWLRQEEE